MTFLNRLFILMTTLPMCIMSSCSEFALVARQAPELKVKSSRERTILKCIKLTPRERGAVEIMLAPFDREDFARLKSELGMSGSSPIRGRGNIQLWIAADGSVTRINGNFDAQVGEHWEFVPEVQKVPTFRPSKKLTMDILSRLSAKGLL